MLYYLVAKKPINSSFNNMVSIFNEIITIISFVSIFIMNLIELPDIAVTTIGWVTIAAILTSLIITWISILPEVCTALWTFLKSITKKTPKPIRKSLTYPEIKIQSEHNKKKIPVIKKDNKSKKVNETI